MLTNFTPLARSRTAAVLLLTATLFSGCAEPMSTGQKSLAGAAAGAAAGGLLTGRGQGALVGAGLGAIAGALIGHAQTEDRRGYGSTRDYPYGEPTRYRGYVYSPYRPHSVIDVRGIPRGELVVDPSTDRVFINP